ncbi:hypothetical protein HYW76_01065 [Candidatus Pacearchaeota archaeon]|nr:hypothetical protein [Candidatus Pacearchaeota archaeon]
MKNNFNMWSVILNVFSAIFLIIAEYLLISGVKDKTKLTIYLIIMLLILIFINLVNLLTILFYEKYKISESIELMKFRMNKNLNLSLLLLGVGIPLFIVSWSVGFLDNIFITITSIILSLVGSFLWEVGYVRRSKILEMRLLKEEWRTK